MIQLDHIYNADCLSGMHDIPDGSVAAVICDLPYAKTRNSWDTVLPFDKLWKHWRRVLRPDGIVILFSQGIFTAQVIMSNTPWFRYTLVWHKVQPSGFLNARRMPLRTHEDICVFYDRLPVYNPIMGKGVRKVSSAHSKRGCRHTTNYGAHDFTGYDSTDRFPTSILTFSKDTQKCAIHPTQKPVALIKYLIRTYTRPGDIVLDNCMGSGTTAVAAVHTGRHFIGYETDKTYWQTAFSRVWLARQQIIVC